MNKNGLVFNVEDRPRFAQVLVFALQQLLAIMAATIAVPAIIGNGMSAAAALFGAGVGTLVYLLFTRFKSPVFLGSSFAFLGSMAAAFAGGVSASAGFLGLIIGAVMAGLVYVVIALIVKFAGVKWVNKLMPAVVIGPTVAIIGLSLAGNAVKDMVGGSAGFVEFDPNLGSYIMNGNGLACLCCGLVTLAVTMICSVYGKKFVKMIPFVIGIAAGYVVASVFTLAGIPIIDFSKFNSMQWYPDFTFVEAFFKGGYDFGGGSIGSYIGTIAVAYVPVAFVVFAEHIADHKNLSFIIGRDLLENPGLHRTLLGDGIGSIAGAFFGGCPNTTYGEAVGCVAISGNASVVTILTTSIMAIVVSFIGPFSTFLATIPSCVMGGVCIALYGFIAVSGLKMIQKVDLGDNCNLFVVSVILIAGVGSLCMSFGKIKLTQVACALILGILTNLLCAKARKSHEKENGKNCETCTEEKNEELCAACKDDKAE